jgi:hypothetical protein
MPAGRIPDIERAVLDAESSVVASAYALSREHRLAKTCECRVCLAVDAHRDALTAWGAATSGNGREARRGGDG